MHAVQCCSSACLFYKTSWNNSGVDFALELIAFGFLRAMARVLPGKLLKEAPMI
jgi:hypothetical protein